MDGINDLINFEDITMSDSDFFAEEEVEEKKKPESSEEEEQEEEEGGKKKPAEQEESLFEEEEKEELSEKEEEQEESKPSSLATLTYLKEKGLVDFELEEDEELTAEKAEEILEDNLDELFEERIKELFADVPDIVRQINSFVLKGGDINEFLKTVSTQNSTELSEDLDLEQEDNQVLVLKNSLKEQGYDDEYIDSQIEFLKDSGRLKKHSKIEFDKWLEKTENSRKAMLKAQEEAVKNDKIQRRKLKSKIAETLEKSEEIGSFTITRKDKKVLPNYMSDRTVKLENGQSISGMQRDLMRVLNSPTGSIQIAKLLKGANENGELNFDDIKIKAETKVAKKVKDDVRRNKKSIVQKSGGSKRKVYLADMFD